MFIISIAAHAQVYKWVDADGKVTYSDVPPPKTAVKVETKAFSAATDATASLPYELAEAVKNMPVTLYTSGKCDPCDEGRSFLKQNGIPFSEKTVSSNADIAKLNAVSGSTHLPVLTIGSSKFVGYNFSEWRTGLTHSGYPESNQLPADYQFPAAQSAAPAPALPAAEPGKAPVPTDVPQRDPNGFQF